MAIACVVGCGQSGPRRYGVSGKVTWKGTPIKAGVINFFALEGSASAGGAPIVDGLYTVPEASGLLEGEYRVSISYPDAAAAKEGEAPGVTTEPKERLPARYNAETELRAKVGPGATDFSFDLK